MDEKTTNKIVNLVKQESKQERLDDSDEELAIQLAIGDWQLEASEGVDAQELDRLHESASRDVQRVVRRIKKHWPTPTGMSIEISPGPKEGYEPEPPSPSEVHFPKK